MVKNVEEHEVEVINLELMQGEQPALHGECGHYFDQDAWFALGHNFIHSDRSIGLVLPVSLKAADEQFCLFHCFEKPRKIAKMS